MGAKPTQADPGLACFMLLAPPGPLPRLQLETASCALDGSGNVDGNVDSDPTDQFSREALPSPPLPEKHADGTGLNEPTIASLCNRSKSVIIDISVYRSPSFGRFAVPALIFDTGCAVHLIPPDQTHLLPLPPNR